MCHPEGRHMIGAGDSGRVPQHYMRESGGRKGTADHREQNHAPPNGETGRAHQKDARVPT